jgi:hypothetical protein
MVVWRFVREALPCPLCSQKSKTIWLQEERGIWVEEGDNKGRPA